MPVVKVVTYLDVGLRHVTGEKRRFLKSENNNQNSESMEGTRDRSPAIQHVSMSFFGIFWPFDSVPATCLLFFFETIALQICIHVR